MAFNRDIAGLALKAPVQATEDRSAIAGDGNVRHAAAEYERAASIRCRARFSLRANGEITSAPGLLGCNAPDCFCLGLTENLLASVHVQDRPGFLKAISDALYEDRPVSVAMRLLGADGARAVRLQVWPTAEVGIVTALLEPVEGEGRATQFDTPADGALGLCFLAQAELLDVASSLSVLCRSAGGGASDNARLETLRYLSRRLDGAAELLNALDSRAAVGAGDDRKSLLGLLQDITGAHRRRAAERRVVLSVEVPGAVREPVPKRFTPLLRLLVSSAVEAVAESGRVAIVTRREGRVIAVSVTFPAPDDMDGSRERAAFDLAVLRNLAIRHGGGLVTIHRRTDARQWVLRLPLEEGASGSDAPVQPEIHTFQYGV